MEIAFYGSSLALGIAAIGFITVGRLARRHAGARVDDRAVIVQHLNRIHEQEMRSIEAADGRRRDIVANRQAQHRRAVITHISRYP